MWGKHPKYFLKNILSYDIAYLISSTVVFGLPNLSETYRETYHVWFLPIFYALAHISRIGSALLTLSISVERYVAITKPFFAKKKMVKSCLIKFSIIFSICYNIPRFFEYTATKVVNDNQEITWKLQPTELRLNPMYVKVYILWFKLVLVELIPYILMAVLNTVIIIYAKKSSSQFSGEQRNNTARQESRMVTVLVLVVFLFIITQSFKLVPDIVEVVLCATGKSSPPDCWNEVPGSVSIISMIAHVCLSFNSSANFLVYVVWGTKFRRALLGLLRRRRPQNPRDETGATRTSPTLTNTYIKKAANRREIAVYTESHSLACVPLPREIGSSSSGGKKSLRFVVEIQDTAV